MAFAEFARELDALGFAARECHGRLAEMNVTEADIDRLLDSLNRLVDNGHSVVVIEHNLDVIKTADFIIDLGPEGGENGGRVVAQGTPEQVARSKASFTGKALAGAL